MANIDTWTIAATAMRDWAAELDELFQRAEELSSFYTVNAGASGDYVHELASDDDEVADSGVTRGQLASCRDIANEVAAFYTNGSISQGDRRSAIQPIRSIE